MDEESLREYVRTGPFTKSPVQIDILLDGQIEFDLGYSISDPDSTILLINGYSYTHGIHYEIVGEVLVLTGIASRFDVSTEDKMVLYV